MSARIWKTRRNKPVKFRGMTITSYDGRPLPKNWQPMTVYNKNAVIASRAEIDAEDLTKIPPFRVSARYTVTQRNAEDPRVIEKMDLLSVSTLPPE